MDIVTLLSGNREDRLRNFDIFYKYYKANFPKSNIIVVSQNEHPDLRNYNIFHIKIETSSNLFNRSLCINHGVSNSLSKFVLIVDSDILIPNKNINYFLKKVSAKNSKFDFAIPYNICNDLSEEETLSVDINNLKGGLARACVNVNKGGALIANRLKFASSKGYPECFWGWGCEDDAFFEISKKLNRSIYFFSIKKKNHLKIGSYPWFRVYHLYHIKSETKKDVYFKKNLNLLKMIKNMSSEEILEFNKKRNFCGKY